VEGGAEGVVEAGAEIVESVDRFERFKRCEREESEVKLKLKWWCL